jgi:hypothetical protein
MGNSVPKTFVSNPEGMRNLEKDGRKGTRSNTAGKKRKR